MRSQARWMFGLIGCVACLAAGTIWAQVQSVETVADSRVTNVSPVGVSLESAPMEPPTDLATPQPVPLEPGTVFLREAREGVTAGIPAGQRAVYSNTLGTFMVPIPANVRIADDLSLSSAPGCRLRSLELPVVPRANPELTGGPFTLSIELWTNCPNSVPQTTTELNRIRIPGSAISRTILTDDPQIVTFDFNAGAGIVIPANASNIWWSFRVDRSNFGMMAGSPALNGFTCDIYDFPGSASACNSFFGGFPSHPYSGFLVELFGDTDTCREGHVAYRANRPSQGVLNPAANTYLTDDIWLLTPSCRMIGYEVAVKGFAGYSFELRNNCDTAAIAGTQSFYVPPQGISPSASSIHRAIFDPPITIPKNFFFAASTSNTQGGVVVAGQQACVGGSQDTFEVPAEDGGCNTFLSPVGGQHDALNVTIICEGAAPEGACCDMFFTDTEGESVCRYVPRMNCSFPPAPHSQEEEANNILRPNWESGDSCESDPFTSPCGIAACCTPADTCLNMTNNECSAVEPLNRPRQWQRGLPCGVSGQQCPLNACLARAGECTRGRDCPISRCGAECRATGNNCPASCTECPPIGCDDASCCTEVCTTNPTTNSFCCEVEWDDECASVATTLCELTASNDVCAPSGRLEGATMLSSFPGTAETALMSCSESSDDPGFGCYRDNPGERGFQTHWYKFIAPPAISPATRSIVNIQTCGSSSPANDSLMQVFAVGDPTDENTQCNSLIPYACSDDFSGPACTRVTTLSRSCVRELIPGNIYYVMVGSKTAVTTNPAARFRLDISQVSSCISQLPDETNNYCPRAISAVDGITPFNLARITPPYTLDQTELCVPAVTTDMWFNYEASCTGVLTVQTCGANPETTQDTNLALYSGCPTTGLSTPLACSQDEGGNCGLGSRVSLDVVQGQQLKIRVGDQSENFASGNLSIACVQSTCPAGEIAIVEDGPNGIPVGAVDARRSHDPADVAALVGTQIVDVVGTRDAQSSCFSLCETASTGSPNSILSVVPGAVNGAQQVYTISLARPITGGAKTSIVYDPDGLGPNSAVQLISHPGNVDADATMNAGDVTAIMNVLDAPTVPPFGLLSFDLNRSFGNPLRSSGITPADILEAVDLANGASAYTQWFGTTNPITNPACP